MNEISSFKAKELADKANAKVKLKPVFEQIEQEANKGKYDLRIKESLMPIYGTEVLTKLGFKVECEYDDVGCYDRSRVIGYNIYWSKP